MRWIIAAIIAVCLTAPTPADARISLNDAARVAVKAASQPSAFTLDNLPVGMPEAPRVWKASAGFCRRDPFVNGRVVNCWIHVEFPDWPGCSIEDKWRVRRIDGKLNARMLNQWTSHATTCPGDFTTYTLEPLPSSSNG